MKRSAEHGFVSARRSAEHGFTLTTRSAEHGFTLVELMVALFIFALLAAAGVALLGFSVRAQGAAGERLDEAAAVRRFTGLLQADLAQAVPRLTRDVDGRPLPAFTGTDGAGAIALGLVRGGWSNPDAAPRASLQRVDWRFADGRIERRSYPMLDGAGPTDWSPVLRGVYGWRLRYRQGADWRDRWDPIRATAMPRAVEAVVELRGTGPLRMLFLSGPGA